MRSCNALLIPLRLPLVASSLDRTRSTFPFYLCALQIPLLLKGHERSITYVVFNADGDLLFTCAKDHTPTVWRTETGERLGTYEGHGGAVWQCAVTRTLSYFIIYELRSAFLLNLLR